MYPLFVIRKKVETVNFRGGEPAELARLVAWSQTPGENSRLKTDRDQLYSVSIRIFDQLMWIRVNAYQSGCLDVQPRLL